MIRGGGFSVLSNQFEQAVDGLCLRDILLDTFLGPIEGNLATTGTDSHRGLELEGLPVWSIEHEGDGVILDTGQLTGNDAEDEESLTPGPSPTGEESGNSGGGSNSGGDNNGGGDNGEGLDMG